MKASFSAMGRAFLRAFVAALVTFGFGILAAPDLGHTYLVGVVALVSLIAGLLRVIQAYLVSTSLATYLGQPYGEWADSFLQAFVGTLVITLTGWVGAPDLNTAKAFVVSAIVGALNAGVRALQGVLTTGEHPAPNTGIAEPSKP